MTRTELKAIIKECLLEVISEGVGSQISEGRPARPRQAETARRPPAAVPALPQRRTIGGMSLDRVIGGSGSPRAQQAPNKSAIATAVRGLTSDPVLSEIFADTAGTTLQEQLHAEKMGPAAADAMSLRIAETDPTDIFGAASSNWAALAFADKQGAE